VHESITTTTTDDQEAEVNPEDTSEDFEAEENHKRSSSTEGHASSFQFYFLAFLSCHSKHSSADDAVDSLALDLGPSKGPGFVPASGQALCTRYSNSSSLDPSFESPTARAHKNLEHG
jgi:hypothetical protein